MGLRPIERSTTPEVSFRAAAAPPRRRGVLGGLVVFAVGFAFFLQSLRVPNAGPLLFLALGLAFAGAYWMGYRQFVYLVPGAILVGLGLGLLIPATFEVGALAAPIFYGALAAAFLSMTILAPGVWWPLVAAVPLALVAIAGAAGRTDLVPAPIQPFIFPVLLMAVGVYLLVGRPDR